MELPASSPGVVAGRRPSERETPFTLTPGSLASGSECASLTHRRKSMTIVRSAWWTTQVHPSGHPAAPFWEMVMPVPEHWSGPYRDDRMYVMRITSGSTRVVDGISETVTSSKPRNGDGPSSVLLITYRNVPSLPAVRSDDFRSIDEALEYVKRVEPTCPRVSLDGRSPKPTPSWQEHLEWLHRLGLRSAAEGEQPRPDWATREGRDPA